MGRLQCRCMTRTGKRCRHHAMPHSIFCAHHIKCPGSPLSGDEPVYNPAKFNHNPLIQRTHNCWAYGMDVLDPEQLRQCDGGTKKGCDLLYHQPGGTKDQAYQLRAAAGRSCRTVRRLMRTDVPDMKPSSFSAKCPRGYSKIALVVHPGEDYHFYRQDADGWWSHKDGSNKVKRVDSEGQPIWNPLTAARDYRPRGSDLNYRNFCGFYCVPRRRTIRLARDRKP